MFRLSIPMVVSMLMQALYNVVDSMFVARMGEDALTAVSLAFPMQMLMISAAVGTGVGMNALISRRLGQQRYPEADLAAANGMFLMVCTALLFLLFGCFGVRPFFAAYTDEPAIRQMGTTYLSICLTLCMGIFLQCGFERVMQAQGKTFYAMLMQITGALVNLVLDPILIFGLLGFPRMGVAGAALATVIGQWAGAALAAALVFSQRSEVRIRLRGFRPDPAVMRGVYRVGLPSIVLQSVGTVMNLVMNAVLIAFTPTAVAVFGVYFKLQSLISMPVFGVNNASMSIMAYNYGARNRARLMRTWRISLCAALCVMVSGAALFRAAPERLLALFDASPAMLALGVPALRVLSLVFPCAAVGITTGTLFQACGNGVYSMFLSIMRQLGALVPAAILLARLTGDVNKVWWSFPLAEIVSMTVMAFFFVRLYRDKIATLPLEAPAVPPAPDTR